MVGSPLGCVEAGLRRGFRVYGGWLGAHPLLFLVLPSLLSVFAGLGNLRWEEEDRVWLIYSPSNARSYDEHAAFRRFFDEEEARKSGIFVALQAADGGSLLRFNLHLLHLLSCEWGVRRKRERDCIHLLCVRILTRLEILELDSWQLFVTLHIQ